MAFNITKAAKLAAQKTNLEPQMVLEIDGVSTRYGVRLIYSKVKIGDEGLLIGNDWKIGGSRSLDDQMAVISFTDGTTTAIEQQLDPSKGAGSSISSMEVALVDIDGAITELVSPGIVIPDILGVRARVYIGLQDTSFPDDYVTIFRGVIDDIKARAGSIVLNIAHPDQKKRQTMFTKQTITATSVTTGLFTVIGVSAEDFKKVYTRGAAQGLTPYLKYGDEYIKISGNGSNSFALTYRAQLGSTENTTTIVADNPGASIEGSTFDTFYVLEGNVIDLALMLMLSDEDQSFYLEELPIASIVRKDVETAYAQGIFFRENVVEKYGVTIGDGVFISNAGSNNFPIIGGTPTLESIVDIIKQPDGVWLILGSSFVSLTEDINTEATASFLSQWNKLGAGLGMYPDEVDIEQHLYLRKTFLSSFNLRFYMKDEVNMKDFIEQELYLPAGAYSLPRKSKASVGLHTGPIPGTQAAILTKDDIKNPSKLELRRTISSNFANTITYQWDEKIDSDDFDAGEITYSAESVNRIKVGTKSMTISSRGMRSDLNAGNLANAASMRRLNRYKYGAEFIESLETTFKKGFNVEIGDVILLNPNGLNLLNSKLGTRNSVAKLFEVYNKSIDFRTGDVRLSIVDTSYSTQSRYGLISPSSFIRQGISETKFIIQQYFRSDFGTAEYLKWSRFMDGGNTCGVKVRSADFTTRFFQTTIKSVIGNEIEVNEPLGFVPQFGDILEFSDFSFAGTTDVQKTLYAFLSDGSLMTDGSKPYGAL